jgi:hypothetical protein
MAINLDRVWTSDSRVAEMLLDAAADLQGQVSARLLGINPLLLEACTGIAFMGNNAKVGAKESLSQRRKLKKNYVGPCALAQRGGLLSEAIYYRYAACVRPVVSRVEREKRAAGRNSDLIIRELEDLVRAYAAFLDFIDRTVHRYAKLYRAA